MLRPFNARRVDIVCDPRLEVANRAFGSGAAPALVGFIEVRIEDHTGESLDIAVGNVGWGDGTPRE